ncbi:MAG: arsenate reductase (azurin) small subunit [Chloroflexi bacterium]|nr:MAG: arsenate reductase (azurin) small subunit [Chloroflexota bacterium]
MSEKLSRRAFLKAGGLVAAVSTAELALNRTVTPAQAQGESGRVTLAYEPTEVAEAKSLKVGDVKNFNFPDASSPCVMLKMGEPVPGGVGPDQDIVAYSSLCSHKGCPVSFDADTKVLKCPCHFTMFDPEKAGQVVIGQATINLPQIVLEYDDGTDSVTAVAVTGLIYGRQANTL